MRKARSRRKGRRALKAALARFAERWNGGGKP